MALMVFHRNYIFLFISIFFSTGLFSQYEEHYVKAAFIEKFTTFIEWPDNSEEPESDTFTIYVLGDSQIGDLMEEVFADRKIKSKSVNIINSLKLEKTFAIDLLYITHGSDKFLKDALQRCIIKPFLIISETDGLARRGSHINFYLTSVRNVHFEMNKTSLDKMGFETDYLLLEYANVILD